MLIIAMYLKLVSGRQEVTDKRNTDRQTDNYQVLVPQAEPLGNNYLVYDILA